MGWMTNAFSSKGYETRHNRRVTTGTYGCPQTRDRLILFAALQVLLVALPRSPCVKLSLLLLLLLVLL